MNVYLPIRVSTVDPSLTRDAFLHNVSMSGGLIIADFKLRSLAPIHVTLTLPEFPDAAQTRVDAYVVRLLARGVGVAWSDPAPSAITTLLRAIADRRLISLREPKMGSAQDSVALPPH